MNDLQKHDMCQTLQTQRCKLMYTIKNHTTHDMHVFSGAFLELKALTQINGEHLNQTTSKLLCNMTNDPLMRTYSFVNIHRASIFKIFNTCGCSPCHLTSNMNFDWCVTRSLTNRFSQCCIRTWPVQSLLKPFLKMNYFRRLN